MANRRSFKIDESFLEKISIGAIATKKVFNHLSGLGHSPIELERGSMSFKIWKEIKIKRVRVPDILCVTCGKRIESRGKTKLEISMSHSFVSPERGWDHGLNDDDFVALVKCSKIGEHPIDWKGEEPVQYIPVDKMKEAYRNQLIVTEKPKGATEGFEARITWPSAKAESEGTVTSLNENRLQYRRTSDNRTVTLQLTKKGIKLTPLVTLNDHVFPNQIIASVVPVSMGFDCAKHADLKYYSGMLKSPSLSERYAAAKALFLFPSDITTDLLLDRMKDDRDHIYVRLEAASSLMKMGRKEPLDLFELMLRDEYLENRLESVIILGEVKGDDSCTLLVKTLFDATQHAEIRAGAAWSLGELKNECSLSALAKAFNEVEQNIRVEAARALVKFGESFTREFINFFPRGNKEERAGLSWALSKIGNFKVVDLLPVLTDDEARKWVAWIIGTQNQATYIDQIEQLKNKDKEVYFAVTVLWQILSSWIDGLDTY
ncbi:MAG: HEAT repeat domain-containing protein [Syntrophaceae bacterium]|nr:HEAT repeat domain-containing protein [Syntrophaceae bacterium]